MAPHTPEEAKELVKKAQNRYLANPTYENRMAISDASLQLDYLLGRPWAHPRALELERIEVPEVEYRLIPYEDQASRWYKEYLKSKATRK